MPAPSAAMKRPYTRCSCQRRLSNDAFKLARLTALIEIKGSKATERCSDANLVKIYAADVEKLSKLPGKDEMRAQLLATFEAPMAQTVAVMQSALCCVLYCLENKAKKESSN